MLSKPSCRGFATPCRHCAMSRRAGFIAATTARGSSGSTGSREAHGCTILATNDVHYHAPDRRPLQDVVTCIREKVTIATAGYLLNPNAERHLKSPDEMVAAVRALAARDCGDARVRRRAPLQPRRAAVRISEGDGARGAHAAAASRASDLGRREGALARRHSRQGAEAARLRAAADRAARLRALFPDRPRHRRLRARASTRRSCARGAGRRRTARSAIASASPRSIRRPATCCSSASSPRSARSRPTSTSISSMSGARR